MVVLSGLRITAGVSGASISETIASGGSWYPFLSCAFAAVLIRQDDGEKNFSHNGNEFC
jgi:hypothetical protein